MRKVAKRGKGIPKKRRQGRPFLGKNDVGPDKLLAATERLLRKMPPARVSMSRVAQEAKVDSALVRYYFGSRTALLVAVVDRLTAHERRGAPLDNKPLAALAEHIGKTVQFVHSANFMHRLIIDELAQDGTADSRARVRAMNLDLVNIYRDLLQRDNGKELSPSNPLFLHLVILGASDFFASAEPLIRELVPTGTDMQKFTADFEKFLIQLVIEGMRKR